MTAFTYECDLDHPVSAEVEKTIRDVLKELLSSQGLEGVLVNPGLDHDGDPVLFVHLKFRLVEPGIDPNLLSQSTICVRRALWKIDERRFPHLRYDFHEDQKILGRENW
jgi:hypothetical protein